jgi:hypothetical protein
MTTVGARGVRKQQRESMVNNITIASTVNDRPGDVVAQALMDIELSLGSGVIADLYQLVYDEDEMIEIIPGSGIFRRKRIFRRCKRDTGLPLTKAELEDGKKNLGGVNSGGKGAQDTDRLIPIAAKVCRHGLAIQSYRGDQSVFGLWWERIHQVTAVPLASIEEEMDRMELDPSVSWNRDRKFNTNDGDAKPTDQVKAQAQGQGEGKDEEQEDKVDSTPVPLPPVPTVGAKLIRDLASLSRRGSLSTGVMIIPVFAKGEALMGMLVARNADKIAHAVYSAKKRDEKAVHTKPDNPDDEVQAEFAEMEAPEDGVIQGLVTTCNMMGTGMLSGRLGACGKRLKVLRVSCSVSLC